MKKVALITGASSGIGRDLANIHAERGGDLVIIARNENKLVELKNELEQKHKCAVKVIAKDLTDKNAVQEIYDELKQEDIQIEYLINNAGFGGSGKFYEREWSEDLNMIHLNIIALTAMTRKFLPDMVKVNQGKILNVSSTAALLPGPLQAVYFATKAYVSSFSNAIAEELHDTNISVTALMPGATETKFAERANLEDSTLFENTATSRSVAETGYEAMIEGKLDVIAGVPFLQKVAMKAAPLVPKKVLLEQMRKASS